MEDYRHVQSSALFYRCFTQAYVTTLRVLCIGKPEINRHTNSQSRINYKYSVLIEHAVLFPEKKTRQMTLVLAYMHFRKWCV